jgi:hypothetical protein
MPLKCFILHEECSILHEKNFILHEECSILHEEKGAFTAASVVFTAINRKKPSATVDREPNNFRLPSPSILICLSRKENVETELHRDFFVPMKLSTLMLFIKE